MCERERESPFVLSQATQPWIAMATAVLGGMASSGAKDTRSDTMKPAKEFHVTLDGRT